VSRKENSGTLLINSNSEQIHISYQGIGIEKKLLCSTLRKIDFDFDTDFD